MRGRLWRVIGFLVRAPSPLDAGGAETPPPPRPLVLSSTVRVSCSPICSPCTYHPRQGRRWWVERWGSRSLQSLLSLWCQTLWCQTLWCQSGNRLRVAGLRRNNIHAEARTMWIAQASDSGGAAVGVILLLLISALMYFIPSIVAGIRKVPNIGSVIVINLFLGWTIIGWVVALAMAARSQPPQMGQIIVNPGSAPPPPSDTNH
jgi:hypothetical protein